MFHLSQTKKIALVAIALLFLSIASITFFLKNGGEEFAHSKADILQVTAKKEEKKVDEDALEYKYRNIVGNFEHPILVINVDGKLTYVSNEFCKLLSEKCSNLMDDLLFQYINSEDLPDFVSAHAKLIADGQKNEALGPFRMTKNEKEILVLFSAMPVLKDKKVVEIVMAAKDLSEKVDAIKAKESEVESGSANSVDKTRDILDKISFAL